MKVTVIWKGSHSKQKKRESVLRESVYIEEGGEEIRKKIAGKQRAGDEEQQ